MENGIEMMEDRRGKIEEERGYREEGRRKRICCWH